jgi:hypothetical protein
VVVLTSGRLRRPVHLRSAAMNSPARFVGTIGGLAEDYLGRSKLEHERAIAASRIVEARGRPELREFNAEDLGPGPFRTLTDSDGNRYRVFSGVSFDRGMLIEHLPETVCAFVVAATSTRPWSSCSSVPDEKGGHSARPPLRRREARRNPAGIAAVRARDEARDMASQRAAARRPP